MTRIVFGHDRPLSDPPPRDQPSLIVVGAILIAIAGALLLAGVARADEGDDAPRFTPSSRSGRAVVQELAERYFPPEQVGWAIAVARCESSFDLYAHSAGYDRRWGVYYDFNGALQVDAVTWGAKAWELFGGPLSEPEINWQMAAWIVQHYGTGHWPYCSNGAS